MVSKLPKTVACRAMSNMLSKEPAEYYAICKVLARMPRKSTIAHSFSIKSVIDNDLPMNYDFGDYMIGLQNESNNKKLETPRSSNKKYHTVSAEDVEETGKELGIKATGVDVLTS